MTEAAEAKDLIGGTVGFGFQANWLDAGTKGVEIAGQLFIDLQTETLQLGQTIQLSWNGSTKIVVIY